MADAKDVSPLEEKLREDIQGAQREHDQVKIDTLRMALNAVHLEEVARTDAKHARHGVALTEQDRFAILEKQVKQRDEAAEIYRKAGRAELAEKEAREATLLKGYLPVQMSDEDIRSLVAGLIERAGRDFRTIMPMASKETKGRADGRRVSELVREMTA
jgi:uncharacterized protein YqeY